jgi:hypothetical protein
VYIAAWKLFEKTNPKLINSFNSCETNGRTISKIVDNDKDFLKVAGLVYIKPKNI